MDKLKAENSGILAWLLRGCLEWQRTGLNPPDIVKAATSEYQAQEDLLGHFIQEMCTTEPNAKVKAGNLYQAYKQWCINNSHKELSGTRFGERIRQKFDATPRTGTGIYYLGIGLLNPISEPPF